jgi:alanyl-tRNA synthetase
MSSEKRYWTEPFLFEGTAIVIATTLHHDKTALVLDRSLFYPEGGGQLGDRGTVSIGEETRVVEDTQINEQGDIFIIVQQPFSSDATGQTIQLHVSEEWRRRQMSQHTGQHLLSRLLQDRYEAPTVSARLGEQVFSVDVAAPVFTAAQIAAIEDELNQIILEDRPIRAWFPAAEELKELPLRKQPSVDEQIRIIQVEGFDITPCGGTHCVRTGQVGMVHIITVEKCKQLIRILATAGLDAVRDFRQKEHVLRQLFPLVSATAETVVAQVEALRAHDLELQTRLKQRTTQLGAQTALHYPIPSDAQFVHVHLSEEDLDHARSLSKELAKRQNLTAMVSMPVSDGVFVVLDRVEKGPIDIGAVLKEVLMANSGKGGGGPLHAEGRAPNDLFLEHLKQRLIIKEDLTV